MRQATSDRIAAARFWIVPALCLAAAVTAVLPLIKPALGNLPVPFIWTPAMLAAAICWMVEPLRWTARFIVFGSLPVLGWLLFRTSYPQTPEAGRAPSDVDKALMATDAATWDQGVLLTLIAAACVCSCGWVRLAGAGFESFGTEVARAAAAIIRDTARTGMLAAMILVLVIAAAVPAGLGVRSASQDIIRSRAASLTRHDPAKTGKAHTGVSIGTKDGWYRTDLRGAVAAGDMTIGIQDTAVLGLRARDGAELWRYRVKNHRLVGEVIVDTHSRTVQIRVGAALIGIGFDGRISYHVALPAIDNQTSRSRNSWVHNTTEPSNKTQTSTGKPRLSRASTAVFGQFNGGHASYGYSVATGRRLWKFADRHCSLTAAGHGKTTYLLLTGKKPCRTRILRFDGPSRTYETTLEPPSKLESVTGRYSLSGSRSGDDEKVPGIQAINSDLVTVQLDWREKYNRTNKQVERTHLIDSSGTVRGTSDRPEYSNPNSLPIPIRENGAESSSRFGMLEPPNSREWVLVDNRLQQKTATALHKNSSAARPSSSIRRIRRMGENIDLIEDGKHHIRRVDKHLTRVETIDSSKLSKCSSKETAWSNGDDDQLVLGCKHGVYVRPIS